MLVLNALGARTVVIETHCLLEGCQCMSFVRRRTSVLKWKENKPGACLAKSPSLYFSNDC